MFSETQINYLKDIVGEINEYGPAATAKTLVEEIQRLDTRNKNRPIIGKLGKARPAGKMDDEVAEYLAGYVTRDDLSPDAQEAVGEVD